MSVEINPDRWVKGTVTELYRWTETLFSLRIKAEIPDFTAGQFTKIGLVIGDELVSRPYSFVNSPEEEFLEFYFVTVPDGPLSSQLVHLKPGDSIWVMKRPSGFLKLDEVPDSRHLWMLSTGTAIGPFLSILKMPTVWKRFEKVVLVHAVRFAEELSFQPTIEAITSKYATQFNYIPFVSRQQVEHALSGRIPGAIESGVLEEKAGMIISPEQSQIMICGNPDMVKDTMEILLERGLNKNRRRTPGHISVENYW
jgi:ferredoxin--NADP+ reductase